MPVFYRYVSAAPNGNFVFGYTVRADDVSGDANFFPYADTLTVARDLGHEPSDDALQTLIWTAYVHVDNFDSEEFQLYFGNPPKKQIGNWSYAINGYTSGEGFLNYRNQILPTAYYCYNGHPYPYMNEEAEDTLPPLFESPYSFPGTGLKYTTGGIQSNIPGILATQFSLSLRPNVICTVRVDSWYQGANEESASYGFYQLPFA